ncbi:alpha-beta hydrolase superfamily lysophospholipase [Fluviicoccus keumensis]|uniref:Alpha-beta hydrolase superfamily lysophospholipase n=1 Tax=Fluviicoccus keumensis TaxID=1435465 RepID=A0A4Q7Z9C4_9GAMM|nr:alpha/beta fold hydrolase [Fluviicoccus keumensis]RZU47110.1 alpha-beta hydrolase superfamily lysophospholipase [Fluviicoccus keumensis]
MKNPHLSQEPALLYLPAPDGHRVPLRHWPVANPRAIVHVVHGMAEHSGNYEDMAQFLNQYGFTVIAHDHRCHGLSVADQNALGAVDRLQNWPGLLQDMLLINNWVRATYSGVPYMILAHSMGSFISQWFAQNHPDRLSALALSGSDYLVPWFARIASRIACIENWRGGKNGRSDIIHGLAFGKFGKAFKNPRTDFDWLSRDEAYVDKYVNDPMCGYRMANAYWRDMLSTIADIYTPSRMARMRKDLPVYVFAGTRDPVGQNGKGVKLLAEHLKKDGKANLTLRLYEEARHCTLSETNASEVRYDLLGWMMERFPA